MISSRHFLLCTLLLLLFPAAKLFAADLEDSDNEEEEDHCERYWPTGELVDYLSDETIDESSGLADSWLHPDRLWTHNDSNDHPRLWALRKDGVVTTLLRLEGADNVDWEDMAIAPCDPVEDPRPCIYVGDFGDNLSQRSYVTIYRFPEPDLGEAPPAEIAIHDFETLHYRYEGGPRDAETLLVHPVTAQIWVIEKTGQEEVALFSVPNEFGNQEPHLVSPVATLNIQGPLSLTRMVTGGDISPDGREFTYRTYVHLYTHCVPNGEDFEAAFSTPPIRQRALPATIQGEALTYDRRDGALWLTSESAPAPLIRIGPRQGETLDDWRSPGGEVEYIPSSSQEDPDDADADFKSDAGIDEDVFDFDLDERDRGDEDTQGVNDSCSHFSPQGISSLFLLLSLFGLMGIRRPSAITGARNARHPSI